MKTWITGGYVYRYEKRRLERKNLCMENGVITKICSPSEAITDGEVYDVKGKAVVPGFIDIHTHGGCGFDVNAASKEDLEKIGTFSPHRELQPGFALFLQIRKNRQKKSLARC